MEISTRVDQLARQTLADDGRLLYRSRNAYAVAALSRPLCGVLWLPWQLFGVRIADRIGKGVRTSPRDALIVDSTSPGIRGRAFGFHRAMDHLGAAIGPLLAAAFLWFWSDGLREMFLLTLIPGLLAVILLLFWLREPARNRQEDPPSPPLPDTAVSSSAASSAWTLRPFDRRFRLYLLTLVIFTLGNSSDAFLLVRAGELGVATWLLPILWCAFHVAKSMGNVIGGRVVDRLGPRPMILGGWIYYAAIYGAFAWATAAWQVWVLFIAYAAFYAVTEPAEKTLVANLVGAENRGLAFGWFHCVVGIATLPASLVFGALYQAYGPGVAFGSGSALAIVAAILLSGVKADTESPDCAEAA